MKRLLLIILLFAAMPCHAQKAKPEAPFVLDPMIGDTLRPAERQFFSLLTRIQDFQWAVFFLNADSTLRARVSFFRNGTEADTVIEKFSSLKSMQYHIKEVRRQKRLTSESSPAEEDFEFRDGTVLRGSLLSSGKDSIAIFSKTLGRVSVLKSQLRSSDSIGVEPEGAGDPMMSRLFLMPTGITVGQGHGYVELGELMYAQVALGITDWLMVNGGFVPWTMAADEQMFSYGAKIRLLKDHKGTISLSVGAEFMYSPANNPAASFGFLAASFGSKRSNFSVLIGFESDYGRYSPEGGYLVGLGFNESLGEHTSLLMETYFNELWEIVPFGAGFRFFGPHFSCEIGVTIFFPTESRSRFVFPTLLPIVSLSYSF